MHKAHKDIQKLLPDIDVIIEVLDARIPFSSSNPQIRRLARQKPVIKLLNKADLADQQVTAAWQKHLLQTNGTRSLLTAIDDTDQTSQVSQLVMKLAGNTSSRMQTINALITGIPNVGKSTIINRLAGKAHAKTGNEPAVTRSQQRIRIADSIKGHVIRRIQ